MKKHILLTSLLLCFVLPAAAEYTDHRNRNIDSLERVAALWTAGRDAFADEEESAGLVRAYSGLMHGYRNINGERSMYFARKEYNLAKRWNWLARMEDGLEGIGIIHYGQERYDSALVYLFRSLEITGRMAAGETSFTSSEPYDADTVDDSYSGLYGAIGNVYNMMGDIPAAMEYYKKAGEIFERHGWNESNSVLWYNMGETWYEEGELEQALECYEKALEYGRTASDSLKISDALKGMGGVYLAKGKTRRALGCLQEADLYYSVHDDQEFVHRMENLEFMSRVLARQKHDMTLLAVVASALVLLLVVLILVLRRVHRLRREKEGADAVIEQALGESAGEAATPADGDLLTDREQEILRHIAAGCTSPQIADKVCLSLPTVKWYRRRLMEKLDASNAAELISTAKEKGLV